MDSRRNLGGRRGRGRTELQAWRSPRPPRKATPPHSARHLHQHPRQRQEHARGWKSSTPFWIRCGQRSCSSSASSGARARHAGRACATAAGSDGNASGALARCRGMLARRRGATSVCPRVGLVDAPCPRGFATLLCHARRRRPTSSRRSRKCWTRTPRSCMSSRAGDGQRFTRPRRRAHSQ